MAKKDTEFDPALAVMRQLSTMDSKSYADEEPSAPVGPLDGTPDKAAGKEAEKAAPKERKGRKEGVPGNGGHVQMYIPSDIYAKLKMAKAAHLFATGEDVSAGRFVGLLIDRGLKAVSPATARVYAKLREEE